MKLTLFPRIQDVDILLFSDFTFFCSFQAAVVQTLDSAIHRIKIYPMDSTIGFPNSYLLDSDLSGE